MGTAVASSTARARSARRRAGWSCTSRVARSRSCAATATTCSATATCARRAPRSSSSRPTPTGCAGRWSARATSWREVDWAEAFAAVDEGLDPSARRARPDAVALYLGNPSVHSLGLGSYIRVLAAGARHDATSSRRAPSTRCRSRSSAGLMFGALLTIPVPDVDRTDHLLMLGANPYASNGSLFTAPDLPGRLKALAGARRQARRRRPAPHEDGGGGRRAPRRSGPAPTRCSCSRSCTRSSTSGSSTSACRAGTSTGVDDVERLAHASRRSVVAPRCGIDAATIRRTARELAARRASRGLRPHRHVHCSEFGTLASWLVDVLNVLTGNLDRRAARCSRCPRPAAPARRAWGRAAGVRFGRHASRVRGLPEVYGELPVVCLAEEIEHAGRRPDPCAPHHRRQPGALDPRRRPARPGVRRRSTSWSASTSTSTRRRATPT